MHNFLFLDKTNNHAFLHRCCWASLLLMILCFRPCAADYAAGWTH